MNWRVWEETDESATAAEASPPFTTASMDLTVMSYNVLAQDLLEANRELYTHCPLEVLDWSNRCRLLLDEIQKWKPDVSQVLAESLCVIHKCRLIAILTCFFLWSLVF